VRIEVVDGHRVYFLIDDAVGVPVNGWVNAQGEDVLVVSGEDARVDDCAPGHFDAFINRLSADNTGGADFIGHFTSLVEHERHDVFVVGDGYDGLNDEFAASNDGCAAGAVIGVFPANASVLLVDADDIVHGQWSAFVGC